MNRPKCPEDFTVEFGKNLISYLGGNISLIEENDCWKEFSKKFPELKDKVEKYFEKCLELQEGNVSQAAYYMCYYKISSKSWAESIIEKDDNSRYAYLMCKFCGSSKSWYESIKNKSE